MADSTNRDILNTVTRGYVEQLNFPVVYNPVELGFSGVTLPSVAGQTVVSNIVDVRGIAKYGLQMRYDGPGSGASIAYYFQALVFDASNVSIFSTNLIQNVGKIYSNTTQAYTWQPGVNDGFASGGFSYTLCAGHPSLLLGIEKLALRVFCSQTIEHGDWKFTMWLRGTRR